MHEHPPSRDGNGRAYMAPEMFDSVRPRDRGPKWHKHPLVITLVPMLITAILAVVISYVTMTFRLAAEEKRSEKNTADIERIDAAQQANERENAKLAERLAGLVTRFEDALQRFEQRETRRNP